ncbi:MAG: protein-L-isoaspartate(D-aspartate) O-methyltransferase [Roseibacillus sp.]
MLRFALSSFSIWGHDGALIFGRRKREGFLEARERMVRDQLVARCIRDERVLAAMAHIPRHEFVPEGLRTRAYEDNPLPIGRNQTISQPFIVARMSELLQLGGAERVLEIGAGCGYQSAVLGHLAGEVCALELESELAAIARKSLQRVGVANVHLVQGDGFEPWPEGGHFDGILCACAPLEPPAVLCAQLAPGGRLVLPIGPAGGSQELVCWERNSEGSLVSRSEGAVRFVPMRHPHFLS